jgi:sporulation protein YlmC with PRC-barrel domain
VLIRIQIGRCSMRTLATTAIVLALATSVASAQQTTPATPATPGGQSAQIMTTMPPEALTVTHWYKQSVYDPSDNKIGEIMDVLLDKSGKVQALIIGVGGFLGIGEKDVAVPFDVVSFKTKDNNKWWPTMNTTKDALKGAPGFKYDRNAMAWPNRVQLGSLPRQPSFFAAAPDSPSQQTGPASGCFGAKDKLFPSSHLVSQEDLHA